MELTVGVGEQSWKLKRTYWLFSYFLKMEEIVTDNIFRNRFRYNLNVYHLQSVLPFFQPGFRGASAKPNRT